MKPKNSRQNTYTKKMLNRIITVALLDMQFPFLLAFLGKQEIAETMGNYWGFSCLLCKVIF